MCDIPQLNNVTYDRFAPVCDRERIQEMKATGGDENASSMLSEFYALFISENQEKIDQLEAVCRDRNEAELKSILHFIAGSATNIGLMRLGEICRGVQNSINTGAF